ncbi:hypothetical protein D9M71_350330 [compost metagenome]
MADGVFHGDLVRAAAVLEEHLHRVGDGALVRLQVFAGVALVLDDLHLAAQLVDQRVGGVEGVFVVFGHQVAEDQRHGGHVLDAVVAVGGVGQRADLGDDADRRFLGADDDAVDLL